jgi:hypothetical protein
MLAKVRNWWVALRERRVEDLGFEGGMAIALLLGVFLRVNGWLGHHISFWLDEAMWAIRLLSRPLIELGIRPIGFVAITRLLVRTFGATEVWFRFLPAMGAIGSLLLMPYIASQLLKSKWLRFLLVLMFAIQPALVDYANEFKPYSWEVLVHTVPVALYLRFRQTDRSRWFYALLGYLPLSFLLAYNMAFAFPGLLLLCLGTAWRSPERRKQVGATLLSGALCAGLGLLMFQLSLKKVTHEERTENYWGQKYDVFYEKSEELSRVAWTFKKYNDMAAFVSIRREYWADSGKVSETHARELGALDRLFWTCLSFAGLWALWRQRRDLLFVLFAPLVVMLLGNLLGKWPLGAFRTNIWVMAYTLPLPFLGMQWVAVTRRIGAGIAALVLTLTVVPGFCFGFDWHGHKRTFTRDFYAREVIQKLYAYRNVQLAKNPNLPRARLLLEPHTWYSYTYYVQYHPGYSAKYGKFFENNFIVDKVGQSTLNGKLPQQLRKAKGEQGLWLVSSGRRHFDDMRRGANRKVTVVIDEKIANEHVIMYVEPKSD